MATVSPETIAIDLTPDGTIKRLENLAWFMDSAIAIPGTRQTMGADAMLSLIPGLGNVAGSGISLYLLAEALRFQAPPMALARMGGNIALDMIAGSIPVIGFVFDMIFKANQRNLRILLEHMNGRTA